MSKKLNIQAVNASREAAANAITHANEVREALIARLKRDKRLSGALDSMLEDVLFLVTGDTSSEWASVDIEFRDQLEPTANSYGYTLVDHATRRDLVSIVPLEQA